MIVVSDVEPRLDVAEFEHRGHAVVNLVHVGTWRRGDDGARGDGFANGSPLLVETGQNDWLAVDAGEVVRLAVATLAVVPLVEAVDRDCAGSLGEGTSEGWLFGHRLRTSVEETVRDGRILRPTWQESPAVGVENADPVALAHREESLLGSDVPTRSRLGVEAGREGRLEQSREPAGGANEGDTSAHGAPFWYDDRPLAAVTGTGYSYEHMFAFLAPRPPIPRDLVATLRPVTLATNRRIALDDPWRDLVPAGGLRRGTTIAVQASPGMGGLSLALSLLTGASARGHWVAVVGVDDPGVVAMADLGIDLRRVLFVPRPRGAWAESVADLLDGVDVVVVRPPARASVSSARTLMDRVRERGAVLIVVSERAAAWPLPVDLSFVITRSRWTTSSRLDGRTVVVRIEGRAGVRTGEYVVELPNRRGRAAVM